MLKSFRLRERRVALVSPSRRRCVPLGVTELEPRAVPALLGQQIFPADNPWNQNISSAPVASNSAAIIAHIGNGVSLHPDWGAANPANGNSPLYGIPFNVVHGNSNAKVNVVIDNYPGESDIAPVPIPANAVLEGDYQNGPNPNGGGYNANQRGDSHLIVWDEDNDTAYELYGVTRPTDSLLFPTDSGTELPHTDGQWHAAQETIWNMKMDTFRTLGATSADAAGLSILAGLARPDEGLTTLQGGQGVIDHALRVTLPGGDVNPQYTYPASHMVNESQGSNKLPLGGRLRLQNTPAVNALIANMPPESQIVAHAMQQYGLIVADIGSALFVTGSSATVDTVDGSNLDLTWDMNDIFASNGLKTLKAGDFDVVNLTPQVTALSASSGSTGGTLTITGQNFSGAAGHLSVLFGNTPATSVVLRSDTQVTAVIPNGTGTVPVTVQSGVIETDTVSSSPTANINAPLFGYGTSAVTSADQFTFGNQTVGNLPPTIGPIAPQPIADGGTLSFTVPASSPGGSSLTFSLGAGAPAGAGINAQTGLFTWTPYEGNGIAPGHYSLSVTATDATHPQLANTTVFTVTVGPSSSVQGSGSAARYPAALGLTQGAEYYQDFITAAYNTYLGRAPDANGLAGWLNQMLNHGLSDERLEAGFLSSPEYVQNHGGVGAVWVQSLYLNVLGRTPASAEVQGWLNYLAAGGSSSYVAYAFTASAERETHLVTGYYQQFLGRTPQPVEVQGWVRSILNGGSNEQVMASFLASAEFFQGHGGNVVDWLFAAYRAGLQREPNGSEYQYWLTRLE